MVLNIHMCLMVEISMERVEGTYSICSLIFVSNKIIILVESFRIFCSYTWQCKYTFDAICVMCVPGKVKLCKECLLHVKICTLYLYACLKTVLHTM